MKKHLFLITIITFGLFYHASFSQDLNSLKNTPLIFKGKVVTYRAFRSNIRSKYTNNTLYASYIINITDIYKGENELKLGTVEIITKAPDGWAMTEDESDVSPGEYDFNSFELAPGMTCIFFCNNNKSFTSHVKCNMPYGFGTYVTADVTTDNAVILEPICNTMNCFFYYYDEMKIINEHRAVKVPKIDGFGKKFNSEDELMEYLKKENIISSDKIIKKKDVNYLEQDNQNKLLYAKRSKNYEKLLNEYQLSLKQNLQKNKTDTNKDIEDITFTFENPTVTGTNPQFFEFDIAASGSTNNTYLDMAMFHMKYNAQVFGTHAVLNNRVHITRGSNFNNINYIDPDTVMADKTDTFSVMISRNGDYSPLNRTQITTTPQTLLHVKMEIVNCTSSTDIEFVDLFFTGMMTTYTLTTNTPATSGGTQYDNVNYPAILAYTLCPPPVITNMFPNPITSGTNSVLTIQGSNFGNTRGTSQLWMCVDEICNFTITNFDYIDYISWSDTEIKFRVPSWVDTLPAINKYKGVGSGNVFVWRSDGATSIPNSFSHLEVSYSNITKRRLYLTSSYKKIPIRVIADYGDTTKYFYLDTSITNSPVREAAVRASLRRWSCNTLINWAIKDNIEAQHFEDNISVIYMDDSFHGDPLASTFFPSTMYLCRDDNGDTIGYFKDIDIGFSRDLSNTTATSWLYDTSYTQNLLYNQHDFFVVAQHELGHAHGLGHVNDTTDIMYYADRHPKNYYARSNLYSSPNAVNGGNYVFQKSQQIHSCNFITQMIPFSSSNCISHISNIFNNDVHLYAYPNPMDDVLNITYNLNHSAVLNFTMYDYLGNIIKQINLGKQNMGSHNIKINVSNFSSGLYLLGVKINDRIETIKLIKE